ncbi:phospholipase A [Caldimonas sp. KR1-144]|uniref:phospholipase A n=1 Tax=Caldimonas sp. KR1-144 TaxID=3400911 RepID=UPI003C0129F4
MPCWFHDSQVRVAAGIAMALQAAVAQADPLADCAAIADDRERLVCYDALAGRDRARSPTVVAPAAPAGRTPDVLLPESPPAGQGLVGPPAPLPSFLSRFWELDAADKRGALNFNGYRANYVLPIHYASRINASPYSPTQPAGETPEPFQRTEAKFQISLRSKLWEGLLLPGADLWGLYTQQSMWQVWNGDYSAPFRNTDYEPELMYMVPTPPTLQPLPFGWRWRYAQLGYAHQSNGQTDPLSRSWNRLYVGAGFEREDVSLMLKLNRRLPDHDDNNPDLTSFRGNGELQLGWTPGRATALLQWRFNPKDWSRGSWQIDWSYPLAFEPARAMRWYVQYFNGYAESLLDYNVRHWSLGLGVALIEF